MPAPVWPRTQLLRHGPELPMAERVDRYRHNIRASGCKAPTNAMPIAAWFDANDAYSQRLKSVIHSLARLDAGVTVPFALAPLPGATLRMSKGARR